MREDENVPPNSKTNEPRLKAPTSLKRGSRLIEDIPKIAKLGNGPVPRNAPQKMDTSTFRSTTFTLESRSTLRPPLKPTVKPQVVTRSGGARVTNVTMPAKSVEVKPRSKWDLRGKMADYEIAYKEKISKAEKTIEELGDQCKKTTEELKVCTDSITELENTRDRLLTENNELTESVARLSEKCITLTAELENSANKIAVLSKESENAQLKNINLTNSLNDIEERVKKLAEEIEIAHTELTHANRQIKSKEVEIAKNVDMIDTMNTEISGKTAELENVNKKYYELQKVKYDMGLELDLKKSNLDSLTIRYETALRNCEENDRNYEKISSQYSALKNDKERLVSSLDIDEEKIRTMTFELETLRAAHANDTNKIFDLQQQINEISSTRDTLRLDLGTTGSEVAFLRHELSTCRKQLGQADVDRRMMHHKFMELRGTIRVCCRVRPLLAAETISDSCLLECNTFEDSMKIGSKQTRETVFGEKGDTKLYDFTFDKLFTQIATQAQVFDEIDPLIQSALDGYSVCIFAYGQTGSGKTYTMEGDLTDPERVGLIQRSVNRIFDSMAGSSAKGWVYKIEASFLEIYNETILDLLLVDAHKTSIKLDIKTLKMGSKKHAQEVDVYVPDLTCISVGNSQEVKKLLFTANRNRTVASTKCNELSSRSHSVFRLKITGTNESLKESTEALVNLVDLAGSERLTQSGAENERLKETQHINKSLSALRTVISALQSKESHVPFRDSKLTRLLQSSLGGNCKTLMFVNISPLDENFNETICSLRFATNVNKTHIGNATKNKPTNN